MLTSDLYVIENRRYEFVYFLDLLIESMVPRRGSYEGGFDFTLFGIFGNLTNEPFILYWDGVDITHLITEITETSITGVVPPGEQDTIARIAIE